MTAIKVKYLRKIFPEIINFLDSNSFKYWIGGGLAEQISDGLIDDNEKRHDLDFHILEDESTRLEQCLKNSGYKIKQQKHYKIRLSGDSDQRGIEFVFLKPNEKDYMFLSRDIVYSLNKSLFGNKTIGVLDQEVRIPSPIKEYVEARKKQSAKA